MIINDFVEKLNSILTNHNNEMDCSIDTISIRDILNKIFPNKTCVDVLYTNNTDKLFFGIMINPTITPIDLNNILFSDNDIEINRYSIEIDSKLFSSGLDPNEISAYMLYEISSMISSTAPISEIRNIIDIYIANNDDCINIKNSINYSQILIFAIKDALTKITSSLYQDDIDFIVSNNLIKSADLSDSLMSALVKIRTSVFGIGSTVKEPKLTLIRWAFEVYKDIKHNRSLAIDMLNDAMQFTASKLLIGETKKTIDSINRIEFDITKESIRIMNEAKSGGLFNNLKRNGLRAIEDDLYEFTIRVKNADTEEDAYYALRQINIRINLLEEYLYNTEGLSESEVQRWRSVANRFRELREQLSRKKIIDKKQYGLFFNYDELD